MANSDIEDALNVLAETGIPDSVILDARRSLLAADPAASKPHRFQPGGTSRSCRVCGRAGSAKQHWGARNKTEYDKIYHQALRDTYAEYRADDEELYQERLQRNLEKRAAENS